MAKEKKAVKLKADKKAPKAKPEVKQEEVKQPKKYDRSANRKVLLDVLKAREIKLNGRKCWELKLSDNTTDIVPSDDPDKVLVW